MMEAFILQYIDRTSSYTGHPRSQISVRPIGPSFSDPLKPSPSREYEKYTPPQPRKEPDEATKASLPTLEDEFPCPSYTGLFFLDWWFLDPEGEDQVTEVTHGKIRFR
jgi:hypothetical protein